MRGVIPPSVRLLVSGGLQPQDIPSYVQAGAAGFVVGSTLVPKPVGGCLEYDASQLQQRARLFVQALQPKLMQNT